jgi:hypothetical protein
MILKGRIEFEFSSSTETAARPNIGVEVRRRAKRLGNMDFDMANFDRSIVQAKLPPRFSGRYIKIQLFHPSIGLDFQSGGFVRKIFYFLNSG